VLIPCVQAELFRPRKALVQARPRGYDSDYSKDCFELRGLVSCRQRTQEHCSSTCTPCLPYNENAFHQGRLLVQAQRPTCGTLNSQLEHQSRYSCNVNDQDLDRAHWNRVQAHACIDSTVAPRVQEESLRPRKVLVQAQLQRPTGHTHTHTHTVPNGSRRDSSYRPDNRHWNRVQANASSSCSTRTPATSEGAFSSTATYAGYNLFPNERAATGAHTLWKTRTGREFRHMHIMILDPWVQAWQLQPRDVLVQA